MGDFVHLHLHSEYSLLDGACRIADIPKMAASLGQSAVAVTDHGVMYGAVAFYNACKAEGVKPIIGCEVYVAPTSRFDKSGRAVLSGRHLILLVKNEIGYRNLSKLVSLGFTEGFYQKPRIDLELLSQYSEGLIALSACMAGMIPQLILEGRFDDAEAYALQMAEIMGEGNFYLELQHHGLADDDAVCRGLAEISAKTGIPLVATNDVHYLKKRDAEMQEVLMCIQMNTTLEEHKASAFPTDEFYFKSYEEMERLFSSYEGAIENTVKIAEQCNFEFEFGKTTFPSYVPEDGVSHKDALIAFTQKGFLSRIEKGLVDFKRHTREEYEERIRYELSVIDRMGFNAYFLIVRDFVAFAKGEGIPVGPGRGSGAGSLVAYCIGITDVDPIQFDLLFERFLNPERVSLPDFDIDFCYMRRDEVLRYVRRKYGSEHVAQIVTFGTMAARAAVRDVGRAMGLPYADVDRVAKMIPRELNTTLKGALSARKELRELYESDETVEKLLDTAMALEGMPRHASTHAAGVVMTERPVSDYVPLTVNDDGIVTEYDMDMVAALGLVKFDFLGLRYLTIISDAVREIRKTDPSFEIEKIPMDDKETYRLISDGQADGVFQLESSGMKQTLMQLAPESLEDIIAAIALYRPGPMDSIPQYIARRHGKEAVRYDIPELQNILGVTYGCIVYQEQVMQIFRSLAGYSFAKADIVRRAMSKKKADVMVAERKAFVDGASKKGIDAGVADKIFDDMVSFASYAFNKSHATAYAVLSYRTAYLKRHYTKEYMAALLTSVLGNPVKIGAYVRECQKFRIRVLPPDINESQMDFSVTDGHIRFGLLALKNVGRTFIDAILAERQKKPFASFRDFVDRMSVGETNSRMIESLIKSGAFDRFGIYRSRLLSGYPELLKSAAEKNRQNLAGQFDFFSDLGAEMPETEFRYPDIPEFSAKELLLLEKESSGLYFTGHLLDDYKEHIAAIKPNSVADVLSSFADGETVSEASYHEGDTIRIAGIITDRTDKQVKGGKRMCFITLEDRYADIEVIVFPNQAERFGALLTVDSAVAISGKITVRDEEPAKVILFSAETLKGNSSFASGAVKEAETKKKSRLYIRVSDMESEAVSLALRILAQHPGNTEVAFFDISTKKYVTRRGVSAECNRYLMDKLREYLGEENVVLC